MRSAESKANQYTYDRQHTKLITIKLNLKTDADILAKLGEVPNMQGYIKTLIRQDIKKGEA